MLARCNTMSVWIAINNILCICNTSYTRGFRNLRTNIISIRSNPSFIILYSWIPYRK